MKRKSRVFFSTLFACQTKPSMMSAWHSLGSQQKRNDQLTKYHHIWEKTQALAQTFLHTSENLCTRKRNKSLKVVNQLNACMSVKKKYVPKIRRKCSKLQACNHTTQARFPTPLQSRSTSIWGGWGWGKCFNAGVVIYTLSDENKPEDYLNL